MLFASIANYSSSEFAGCYLLVGEFLALEARFEGHMDPPPIESFAFYSAFFNWSFKEWILSAFSPLMFELYHFCEAIGSMAAALARELATMAREDLCY